MLVLSFLLYDIIYISVNTVIIMYYCRIMSYYCCVFVARKSKIIIHIHDVHVYYICLYRLCEHVTLIC